jgi:hypothetical protein
VSSCGTSSGYPGSSYYPGAYAKSDSIPCSVGSYYDRWSFYASSDDYVSISVDTVSSSTTFDPLIVVTDIATCELLSVGDSFSCSEVPVVGVASCPSARLFATAGEQYFVLVASNGYCAGATGEYELVLDAPFDPSLTLTGDDRPRYVDTHVQIVGTATLPKKP